MAQMTMRKNSKREAPCTGLRAQCNRWTFWKIQLALGEPRYDQEATDAFMDRLPTVQCPELHSMVM